MKNFVVTSFGLLLAISAAGADCWAADVFFTNGGDFNTATNWSDGMLPSLGINYFIQDGLTSTYSAGTLSLQKLVVSDSSAGTFNMTGGDLTLAGGGDSFQIGRGLNSDPLSPGGLVDLSGTAILRTTSNSGVGERDDGVLHIGPTASVLSPGCYWRVGNFGPSVDEGLEGKGLLDVEGTFVARDLFIGVNDGTGVLQVRGTGSVMLTPHSTDDPLEADIVDFNHDPILHPNQSGTIHMVGSAATLSARSLLFDHDAASPIKNLLWFTADLGGVSEITLTDAVNIDNNALRVDLTGLAVAPGAKILLIDAAPNRVFGTFDTLEILGANPLNYMVVYDQPNGNILLMNSVPGDVNFDGTVNIFDINLVSSHWSEAGPAGDANHDGTVNIFDINLISANWTPTGGGGAVVPEPGSAFLSATALVGLLVFAARRGKKSRRS